MVVDGGRARALGIQDTKQDTLARSQYDFLFRTCYNLHREMGDDMRDIIRVNDVTANVSLSTGAAWPPKGPKPTLQPVTITAAFPHDVRTTAETDDLVHSINYSSISSSIRQSVQSESNSFQALEHLCSTIFESVLHAPEPLVTEISLRIVQLKGPVHCRHVGLEATSDGATISQYKTFFQGIQVPCIIGINKSEREETQDVLFDVTISANPQSLQSEYWVDFRSIVRSIYEVRLQLFSLFLQTYSRSK